MIQQVRYLKLLTAIAMLLLPLSAFSQVFNVGGNSNTTIAPVDNNDFATIQQWVSGAAISSTNGQTINPGDYYINLPNGTYKTPISLDNDVTNEIDTVTTYRFISIDSLELNKVHNGTVYSTDTLLLKLPFQIKAIDKNRGLISQKGLTFQASHTSAFTPVTWELVDSSGDVKNVTIDQSGLVTYDIKDTIYTGFGDVIIKATDTKGTSVEEVVKIRSRDPYSETALACNNDLIANSPNLVTNLNLFGLVEQNRLFTDLGKTTNPTNNQEVLVLEDATGMGDMTTWGNTGGPDYIEDAIAGRPILSFNQSQNDAVGLITGNGTGAFKLVALVSATTPLSAINSSTIISAVSDNTLGAGNTGVTTWQVSSDSNNDNFIFRTNQSFISRDFETFITSDNNTNEVSFGSWTDFADGVFHLLVLDYDGTQLSGYMDGSLRFTVTVGTSGLTGNQIRFGINRASSNFIDFELAELAIGSASMTSSQLTDLQSYILCKYNLDPSLISDPGPFGVENRLFGQPSQFVLRTFSDGQQDLWDALNEVVYQVDDVPAPGLGLLQSTESQTIAQSVSNNLILTAPNGNCYKVGVDNAGSLTLTLTTCN